jgi:hypothetical protein
MARSNPTGCHNFGAEVRQSAVDTSTALPPMDRRWRFNRSGIAPETSLEPSSVKNKLIDPVFSNRIHRANFGGFACHFRIRRSMGGGCAMLPIPGGAAFRLSGTVMPSCAVVAWRL